MSYSLMYTSSCDVPCDILLGSVCQQLLDTIEGETHEMTIVLMHVDELVYAIASYNASGKVVVPS